MNNETKMGLGMLGLMALCCGGPLIVSALATGAVLGVLGAVLDGGRLLLLGAGAVLVGLATALLVARRFRSRADGAAASCALPMTRVGVGQQSRQAAQLTRVGQTPAAVDSRDHRAAD